MANDYDDDRCIRDIIRNTENGHFLNTDGDYYLGTRQLTFPRNYDIPEYPINVDRLKFNRELNDLYYNYDSISQKYRTFWGYQHEPEMYKSFPMSLNLLSGHNGSHPVRWSHGNRQHYVSEYLNPLRNPMDGDLGEALDRFRKATVQDIQNICVFCMSHSQPEDCVKYWTPMERHERLQNINYTLFLQGLFQICVSCLQREHEHRGFEVCMQARNCSYCLLPGHHKALCTSAVHHQSLAKNRADNDARERLQRNLRNPAWRRANPWGTLRDNENGVGNDIYLMMMMKADKKRTAVVSEEVNRRVAEIYENTIVDRVDSLSTDFGTTSLEECEQASSEVTRPTFFNLLEGVSTELQTVLLDKCTVLELSALAGASRSIREGAIATLSRRSLTIVILRQRDLHRKRVISYYIMDLSDESRTIRIDVCSCGQAYCHPSKKLEQLAYFCRYAQLQSIHYGDVFFFLPVGFEPTMFAPYAYFRAHRGLSAYSGYSKVVIEKCFARYSYRDDLISFVYPRHVILYLGRSFHCLEALFNYLVVTSAESIGFVYDFYQSITFSVNELMLKLPHRSISFATRFEPVGPDNAHDVTTEWIASYVVAFVEQWIRGNRVVDRVHCPLKWSTSASDFGIHVLQLIQTLKQPPELSYIYKGTSVDDKLRDKLQIMNGCKSDYDQFYFSPDVVAIYLKLCDGRLLTIVLRSLLVPISQDVRFGFIDIIGIN